MKEVRLAKVLQKMEEFGLTQIIVTEPSSVFYLTGKWIEPMERMMALLICSDGQHKFFLNTLFSAPEDFGIEKVRFGDDDDGGAIIAKYINKKAALGVDKFFYAHFLLSLMREKGDTNFINSSPIIDRIRMIKDAEEIALMKKSSAINDIAMERLVSYLAYAPTEKEMSLKLGKVYTELGAQGFSFTPIISYGKNAAIAHAGTNNIRPQAGESCVLDIGCVNDYYCSDMTRTVFYKTVSDRYRKIYEISLAATLAGEAAVKPDVRFCDIDKAARDVIVKAGYGDYFPNRVGHSIGLNCHDFGNVSSANTECVQPGMIFSIEPSIKLPGEMGVRVEDLVLVTENGCEVLNHYRRDLQIVG